jgi:hypothetical protein
VYSGVCVLGLVFDDHPCGFSGVAVANAEFGSSREGVNCTIRSSVGIVSFGVCCVYRLCVPICVCFCLS